MKVPIAVAVLTTAVASLSLSDLAPEFRDSIAESTEIIDAIVVRIWDDGGVKLDVRDAFKGEFIPKSLRARHSQRLEDIFVVDGRYLIFLYDHYYVEAHSIFEIEERQDGVFCRCRKNGEWLDTKVLQDLVVGDVQLN